MADRKRVWFAFMAMASCAYTEEQYVSDVVEVVCDVVVACGDETFDECHANYATDQLKDPSASMDCPDGVSFVPADARACSTALKKVNVDGECRDELAAPPECQNVCFPDVG